MPIQTIMTKVTFKNPFSLGAHSDPQPAGRYSVETDVERLEGLSFIVYRRVRTFIHIPSRRGRQSIPEILVVDPSDLELALQLDARISHARTNPDAGQVAPRSRQVPALTGPDRQVIERRADKSMAASAP